MGLGVMLPWSPAMGASSKYEVGKHYLNISNKQRTPSVGGDKVEITEFFWYGCAHCQNYDPIIHEWYEKNKDKAKLLLVPVVWNDMTRAHAKLFYVAQSLGVSEKMHSAFFNEILLRRNFLKSKKKAMQFFEKHGVSPKDFDKAWSSFLVKHAVERAARNTRRYEVKGTPAIVINGEYLAGPSRLVNYRQTLEIADLLIERVLKRREQVRAKLSG
jgi:thiol:disulfide interchange protein DsbA